MSLKHCLVVILAPTLLLLGCGSPPSAAPASSPPASSAAPASKPAASPSQASAAAAVSAKPAASSAPKPAASASAKPAASGAAASAKPSAPAATPTARTGGDPQGFPIRFQSGSPALSSIVLYAALDEGFFKDQHLAVSIIPVAGGLPTLGALTKGEIEFNTNPGDSIQGANQGLPLKVVYSTWAKSPWTLIGKFDIKSLNDLKGKVVGTTQVGSTTYLFLQAALEKAGMSLNDVQLRTLPGTTDVYNLLMNGGLDAGVVSPPSDAMAEAKGFHEVAFIGDALELPYQGLGTTASFIADHRQQAVATLRAQVLASRWLKANPDQAVGLVTKYLASPQDIAKKSVDKMLPLLSDSGEVSRNGVQQLLDIQSKASNEPPKVTPEQAVDFGPLHEALAQG